MQPSFVSVNSLFEAALLHCKGAVCIHNCVVHPPSVGPGAVHPLFGYGICRGVLQIAHSWHLLCFTLFESMLWDWNATFLAALQHVCA